MFLDYFALFMTCFVVIFVFYAVIVIHDIPYEIAKERDHPHQDAIHVAGWVSLFTLHVIWPFLWIWSTLYRADRGWGFKTVDVTNDPAELEAHIKRLSDEVAVLQAAVDKKAEG